VAFTESEPGPSNYLIRTTVALASREAERIVYSAAAFQTGIRRGTHKVHEGIVFVAAPPR
jgi:hypothetical protein